LVKLAPGSTDRNGSAEFGWWRHPRRPSPRPVLHRRANPSAGNPPSADTNRELGTSQEIPPRPVPVPPTPATTIRVTLTSGTLRFVPPGASLTDTPGCDELEDESVEWFGQDDGFVAESDPDVVLGGLQVVEGETSADDAPSFIHPWALRQTHENLRGDRRGNPPVLPGEANYERGWPGSPVPVSCSRSAHRPMR